MSVKSDNSWNNNSRSLHNNPDKRKGGAVVNSIKNDVNNTGDSQNNNNISSRPALEIM
jgi:hypothetical protein